MTGILQRKGPNYIITDRPLAVSGDWQGISELKEGVQMPPFDAEIAKPRSKSFDLALSLIAAFVAVAIIMVARY
ncbi:MAG TPA: hypothetical protein VGZ92_08170 [Bradyrhizobium sp.]|nr:hypothetical protein [Bradyrhizobium sp.]